MQNDYHKLSPAALVNLLSAFITATGSSPASWGLSPSIISAVEAARDTLQGTIDDAEISKANYRSSVDSKSAAHKAAIATLATTATTMYNYSGITPAKIAASGLQPRATTRTKVVPSDPFDLIATPALTGEVSLKWNRNGNPNSVTFVVETSPDCETWTTAELTTKASTTLTGFPPSVTAWFRVTATRNGLTSFPSNEAPIYPTGDPTPALKVA